MDGPLVTLDLTSDGAPKRAKLDRDDFPSGLSDFDFYFAGTTLVGTSTDHQYGASGSSPAPEDSELVAYTAN